MPFDRARIETRIYQSSTRNGDSLDHLDFGPLLGDLAHRDFAPSGFSVSVSYSRTKEIEFVLDILVQVANQLPDPSIIASAISGAVAAKLCDWVVSQLRRLGKSLARIIVGTKTLEVNVNKPRQAKASLERLIETSLGEGYRITIIFDPREDSRPQPGSQADG